MQHLLRLGVAAAAAVLSVQLYAADVTLTSEAGITTPVLLVPSSAADFSITVGSLNQYAGDVTFTAQCCVDYFTNAAVTPTAVFVTPPHDILHVPAGASTSRVVEIRAGSAAATGKYYATVNVRNAADGIDRSLRIAFAVNAGSDFIVQNHPIGTTSVPDLTPTPKSATYQLFITSTNRFSGPVRLTASCCFDIETQSMVAMPEISFSISAPTLYFTGEGTPPGGRETLSPTITVSTMGMPPLFGKFLLAVNATSQMPAMTRTTNVEFSEFAVPNLPVLCRPGVEVLDIGPFVATVANIREQNATKPIPFAMATKSAMDGWQWTIEEDPTLTRNEATIVLQNTTGTPKAITTMGCSRRGQTLRAQGGVTTSMRIMTPTDSTIVFSKEVCTSRALGFLWCTSTGMMDVAVLTEPGFWRLVGGRKNTFTWYGH